MRFLMGAFNELQKLYHNCEIKTRGVLSGPGDGGRLE